MPFDISIPNAITKVRGHFACREDQTVLDALNTAGQHGIRTGCRGGGCGICRVQVLSGRFRTGVMSRAQISVEQESEGYALACKLYPQSDLSLQVVPVPGSEQTASIRSLWLGTTSSLQENA